MHIRLDRVVSQKGEESAESEIYSSKFMLIDFLDIVLTVLFYLCISTEIFSEHSSLSWANFCFLQCNEVVKSPGLKSNFSFLLILPRNSVNSHSVIHSFFSQTHPLLSTSLPVVTNVSDLNYGKSLIKVLAVSFARTHTHTSIHLFPILQANDSK